METMRFCPYCGAPLTPHGICEDDCDGFRASELDCRSYNQNGPPPSNSHWTQSTEYD